MLHVSCCTFVLLLDIDRVTTLGKFRGSRQTPAEPRRDPAEPSKRPPQRPLRTLWEAPENPLGGKCQEPSHRKIGQVCELCSGVKV